MDTVDRAVRIQERAEDSFRLLELAMEICVVPMESVGPTHLQFLNDVRELRTYIATGSTDTNTLLTQ